MKIKPAVIAWGVVSVVFFVVIHPRPAAPSPFSTDEAFLANWVCAIFYALCFFALPPTVLWAIRWKELGR